MNTSTSNIFICHECIGEEFLSNEILDSGNSTECSFCGETSASIKLDELGDRIHNVIENYFYLTSSEPEGYEYYLAKEGLWDREGYPVEDTICDIALIGPEVGARILEYLSDTYDAHGKHSLYEDQPYDSDAHYAEKAVDTFDFHESWTSFKYHIRTRSRYFNSHAIDVLNTIFQNLNTHITHDGESVIQEMPANDINKCFYRARVALSTNELKDILRGLPKSLGSPPHKLAKSGRMNAYGISVFYGAMDLETCITEVRAPVGSSIVVGEFYPKRPLRILDLNRLQKLTITGSRFNPNHIIELSRAIFLQRLVDELSSPVLPGSEEREYLPTQVIAEYLAQLDDLNLDGVIFKSSQVTDGGQNIVLFNHASVVEPHDLPKGTEISIYFGNGNPDDYDPTITIWEDLSTEEKEPPEKNLFTIPSYTLDMIDSDENDLHDSTLKLEMGSIKVHEVQSVKYKWLSIDVGRRRMKKRI